MEPTVEDLMDLGAVSHPYPVPIPNMNGTDRDELIEQKMNAKRHVDAAIKAVQATMPHGRDYILNKPGECQAARDHYHLWLQGLRTMSDDLEREAIAIMNY